MKRTRAVFYTIRKRTKVAGLTATEGRHYLWEFSFSSDVGDGSGISDSAGTLVSSAGRAYSSFTQAPRSSNLQRSEQNGRKGLPFHSMVLPQVGQFIAGLDLDAQIHQAL